MYKFKTGEIYDGWSLIRQNTYARTDFKCVKNLHWQFYRLWFKNLNTGIITPVKNVKINGDREEVQLTEDNKTYTIYADR